MKMSKNYKKLCLALGLTGLLGAGAVTAQSGTQNLQATYRNIKVTYNGETQSMANEPFLVNGSTYVPLRAIGDIFNANATWDAANNTVVLSGGSTTTNEAQLAQLNYQIATLQRELSQANAELAQYKANSSNGSSSTNNGVNSTTGTNITTAQLQDTEDYLNESFSTTLNSKITTNYSLSLLNNKIDVVISYDSKTANRTYDELNQDTIEKFIRKVCDNIAATHSNIAIEGIIEYTGSNEEKASFSRNARGSYEYSHAFDEDTLIEAMKDETDDEIYLDDMTDFSDLDISDYDVDIRENKSTINAKITVSEKTNFATAWDNLSNKGRNNAIVEQLEDIQEALSDIATNYDDITVTVYYGSSSTKLAYLDADGDIETNTINK